MPKRRPRIQTKGKASLNHTRSSPLRLLVPVDRALQPTPPAVIMLPLLPFRVQVACVAGLSTRSRARAPVLLRPTHRRVLAARTVAPLPRRLLHRLRHIVRLPRRVVAGLPRRLVVRRLGERRLGAQRRQRRLVVTLRARVVRVEGAAQPHAAHGVRISLPWGIRSPLRRGSALALALALVASAGAGASAVVEGVARLAHVGVRVQRIDEAPAVQEALGPGVARRLGVRDVVPPRHFRAAREDSRGADV